MFVLILFNKTKKSGINMIRILAQSEATSDANRAGHTEYPVERDIDERWIQLYVKK